MRKRTEPEGRCALFGRRPPRCAAVNGVCLLRAFALTGSGARGGSLRRGEREGVGTEASANSGRKSIERNARLRCMSNGIAWYRILKGDMSPDYEIKGSLYRDSVVEMELPNGRKKTLFPGRCLESYYL